MSTVPHAPASSGLWHGLVALGHHMQKHGLPDFGQVDVEDHHLIVHLAQADAEAWQASIDVDTVDVQDAVTGGLRERVLMTGRLPDTCVRVHLSWYRSKTCQSREPVALAHAVAEVMQTLTRESADVSARCEHCGRQLDEPEEIHGVEYGQTLCSDCCYADKRTSHHRACCETGAIR